MFTLPKEKIKPIVSISIDDLQNVGDFSGETSGQNILFLKKDGQLISYIHFKAIQQTNSESLIFQDILEWSVSLKHVPKMYNYFTLPAILQILGSPIVLIKNDINEIIGYTERSHILSELMTFIGKNNFDLHKILQSLSPDNDENFAELTHIKELNTDLNAILSTIYDEILVVNREGVLIRCSENFIHDFWGVQIKQVIGKNLLVLEKEGFFTPSVTRLVLEQKRKISVVQETKSGKKVLAVGNPIFDENGEIDRVVIASRDITETTKLKKELQKIKKISNQYKQELDEFKKREMVSKKVIYCSPKMERIMDQIMKVSEFSSTVLILGESGVGKEVIAQAIHQLGNRSDKPFLKLNCGAIPETLLESELFGYEKGSFTGADRNGKKGYFQQADKGILFLDEIGEMPTSLQVKLLRVLQEKEVIPIGSTKPIPIDVQIIAATNKDLKSMVEEGSFREDLYYRLNVIPIQIPPLRERPEDIPLLAFHFLQQLNERYNKNFHLLPDAYKLLEVYYWPGNVRELQNVIERLAVSCENSMIDAYDVNRILSSNNNAKPDKPIISRIIPLQEALDYVEEQLVLLAMKQYKTTSKAAKALGISQSSVSRKYQKIMLDKKKERD